MSDLAKLAKRLPDKFIHKNPSGGGDYVTHSVITQKLLATLGPYDFELVEVIRGDLPAVIANPQATSKRGKAGTPLLTNAIVGAVCRITATVDGRVTRVEEVGDCEDPHNWPHDGARLKDAMSDALKRCAMRLGLALHLWADDEYVLDAALNQETQQEDRTLCLVPLFRRDGSIRDHAKVDEDDYDQVIAHRWFFDGGYAATKIDDKNFRLHRFVLGLEPGDGTEVDHINLDRLDNRRTNLRIVSHAVNSRNAPSQGGTSRFRGVVWDAARSKWRAQARFDYRMYFLGRFDFEEDAASAVEQFWSAHSEDVESARDGEYVLDKALIDTPAPVEAVLEGPELTEVVPVAEDIIAEHFPGATQVEPPPRASKEKVEKIKTYIDTFQKNDAKVATRAWNKYVKQRNFPRLEDFTEAQADESINFIESLT